MTSIRKFTFERSFDPATPAQLAKLRAIEEVRRRAAEEAAAAAAAALELPPPEPDPVYTQADLDAAMAQARLEGNRDGEAAALASIAARHAAALESLAAGIRMLGSAQAAGLERIEGQAAALTVACLRHLFPALVALAGPTEIEPLIRQAVGDAYREPRLILRCSGKMLTQLEPALRDAAEEAGFEGRLVVRVDTAMGDADCRIEWGDGGLERDTGKLWAELTKLFAAAVTDAEERHVEESVAVPPQVTEEPAAVSPQVIEESLA